MRRAALAALLALAASAPLSAGWFRPAGDSLASDRKLFDAGKYAAVIADLSPERMQRLRGDDLDRAYLMLAESLQQSGSLDKALGVYQLGVRLFPNDLRLLTELAVLLHQAGLHEQAEPLFEKVLQIHPNNAAAHLGLAEIDAALGLFDDSADHYEKALETLGRQPDVWRAYAELLLRMRELKTAELAAGKALELSPGDEAAQIDLAQILRAQGRLPEALAKVEAILARQPGRADLLDMRGLWLLEAARFDDALAAANAALDKDERDPLAHWIRARVELKADRYNDAVSDLRAAAAQPKTAPFVARASAALLERLQGAK